MDKDLQLSVGNRYSIATMMVSMSTRYLAATDPPKFFVPYIIFQFPANIVIRKLGAAKWLGGLVTTWGGVTVGMGFLTDWTQLLGCRIILGVLEVSLSFLPFEKADD